MHTLKEQAYSWLTQIILPQSDKFLCEIYVNYASGAYAA